MGVKLVCALLLIFNVILFVIGLALAGIGVWSVVDKVYVADVVGDDLFRITSFILIVSGAVVLSVSIAGLCAVRKERRLLVIIYFILLLVVFIILLLAGILAVAFKAELEEQMIDAMRDSLVSGYGADPTITESWDRLQSELECCGVRETTGQMPALEVDTKESRQDSWLLFQQTRWYQSAREQGIQPVETVPESCCVFDPNIRNYLDKRKCQTWEYGPPGNLYLSAHNNALFYRGCYEQASQFLKDQADVLLGFSFSFAILMIGGLILTLMLYRLLQSQTRIIRNGY